MPTARHCALLGLDDRHHVGGAEQTLACSRTRGATSVNHAPLKVRGPCQLNDAPMRRALDPERCIASSTGCIIKSPARARLDGSGSKQRPTKSRMIDVVDGAGAPTASTPSCQHAAKQSIATATTRADSRNNQPRTEVIQAARVAAQHVNNCVAGHRGVSAATHTHTHTHTLPNRRGSRTVVLT